MICTSGSTTSTILHALVRSSHRDERVPVICLGVRLERELRIQLYNSGSISFNLGVHGPAGGQRDTEFRNAALDIECLNVGVCGAQRNCGRRRSHYYSP